MTPKQAVVISRCWDNPSISIKVTDKEIGIEMNLADFITALAQEVGSPALLFMQQTLLEYMRLASERIIESMKQETAKVM